MRIILLFLASLLFANEKLLIAKFTNLKSYYYNNQIVHLRLKTILAEDGILDVKDDLNISNIYTVNYGDYFISNIDFKLNKRFPVFYIKLLKNNKVLDKEKISIKSKIRKLYPSKDFCNVLANSLQIKDSVLSVYNHNYNIIYFTIVAKDSNAEDFSLGYKNEKIYLISDRNNTFSYSYSAMVPKNKYHFNFVYFNVPLESYKRIKFTLKLKDETISTQTNIKPLNTNYLILRDIIGVAFIILFLIIYLYRRGLIYPIFIIIILGYLVYINIPREDLSLKKGISIKLLPFNNSTTLYITEYPIKVKVLREKDGWKKIDFKNKIGWVKDE